MAELAKSYLILVVFLAVGPTFANYLLVQQMPDNQENDFSGDQESQQDESFKNTALYREFLAEREEILRHKWIESEKAGYDIGFERALLDWIIHHRSAWRTARAPAGGHSASTIHATGTNN